MSIPKEPRQLMINIMYLVLTAMLALNISAEILKAFASINKDLEGSQMALSGQIDNTMAAFESKKKIDKRAAAQEEKAELARVKSEEIRNYIAVLKDSLISKSGGYYKNEDGTDKVNSKGEREMSGLKNKGTGTNMFVVGEKDPNSATGELIEPPLGPELKQKLQDFRKDYIALFEDRPDAQQKLDNLMPLTDDDFEVDSAALVKAGEYEPWSHSTFYQLPMVATLTLLTKFQNNIQAMESMVVDEYFSILGNKTIVFDELQPAVIPNAKKFITGEEVELQVYLAASSSKEKPTIKIDGSTRRLNKKGIAEYSKKTSGTGKRTININISAKDGFGDMKSYPAKFEYEVVPPPDHVAVVSPTQMNVFYIGVDNPVEASIAGIRPQDTEVNMSNGNISPTGENGKYTVTVSTPGKATINLSGPTATGGTFTDSKEFRIKRIPDPIPKVGRKNGGALKTGEAKAQLGVIAELENFDFNCKYEVLGFEFTLGKRRQDLQTVVNAGTRFSTQVNNLIRQISPGDMIFFDKIKAKGCDGTVRDLGSVAFKII